MRFSESSDDQLMRLAAGGDFKAFEEALHRHQQRLHNFLYRATGSELAAASLFTLVWVDLYKLRGSHAVAGNLSVALFSLAARRAAKLLQEQPHLHDGPAAAPQGDPGSLEFRADRLRDGLLSLPLKERFTLLLTFFDSLSWREAGAALNDNDESAKLLAVQGLTRLRQRLGDDFFEGGLAKWNTSTQANFLTLTVPDI